MNKLHMQTPDIAEENFQKLRALFPNAVTEAIDPETGEVVRAIDKDALMQEINSRVVEGREERYQFTWPDKRKAVQLANAPIRAALRPVREDSVGKDGTPGGWDSENLYIEGDNLDVLKLLRETYLGKVKMIYIDPPYNTATILSTRTTLPKTRRVTYPAAGSTTSRATVWCRTLRATGASIRIG